MLCFVDGWLLYRSSRVVTESGSLESTAIMKYSYVKKKKKLEISTSRRTQRKGMV